MGLCSSDFILEHKFEDLLEKSDWTEEKWGEMLEKKLTVKKGLNLENIHHLSWSKTVLCHKNELDLHGKDVFVWAQDPSESTEPCLDPETQSVEALMVLMPLGASTIKKLNMR